MTTFSDPFEAVMLAAVDLGARAHVVFVHSSELPRLWPMFWRRAKGVTWWPEDGLPVVMIDAGLQRGVEGTLDIMAHELAHVIAGHEDGHGPAWAAAYEAIFEACSDSPTIEREVTRA